jgi:DNA polymerase-3 subunit epsilon
MREIVIDTETTGLNPREGHRIVEVACIELLHHIPTGRKFHRYVNPERDMPAEAFAVHGLSAEFLAVHPRFAGIVDELLAFIGDDTVVIHNAEFDLAFLNAELARLGRPSLACAFVDTLAVARQRFPGAPASLDALCRRFSIDNSNRTLHGALLDAQLLGEVYLELQGGRQPDLVRAGNRREAASNADGSPVKVERVRREPRPHAPTEAELEAHAVLLGKLKNPLWLADAS